MACVPDQRLANYLDPNHLPAEDEKFQIERHCSFELIRALPLRGSMSWRSIQEHLELRQEMRPSPSVDALAYAPDACQLRRIVHQIPPGLLQQSRVYVAGGLLVAALLCHWSPSPFQGPTRTDLASRQNTPQTRDGLAY
ncbi:hypothetical protein LTR24_001984 [Lithohypha guttulata]|uniref:Uncharacterized protein n=1 Tax=Lithohypha guttulata TaxID=1690604 RepID=A0ABR0KL23_9EURO|nr:hypothetical protein LTR24_001984 [Lithohypha guttulata]